MSREEEVVGKDQILIDISESIPHPIRRESSVSFSCIVVVGNVVVVATWWSSVRARCLPSARVY